MPAIWILFLWFVLPVSGYVAGYTVAIEQRQEQTDKDVTYCSSPQHEGDKTIGTLIKRDGGLVLLCEYHSLLKSTNSPNRGEKK